MVAGMAGLEDSALTEGGAEGVGRWRNALTRPEDPDHDAPAMLLYRLLKLAHLIQRPFLVPGTNA